MAVAVGLSACGSSGSSGGGGNTGAKSSKNGANKAATPLGTVLYGTLPPTGTPQPGGTVTVGQLSGQTPSFILPIVGDSNITTGTISFNTSMYMPLYSGPAGAEPKVDYGTSAAASAPVPSNGDKTYTVHLRTGMKWSDGKPITANDLIFEVDLLKAAIKASPANWAQYTQGEFPTDVTSMSAPNSTTVVMNLDKAYNPGFFLNNQLAVTDNVYPLPSQDWNIAKAGGPHLDYTVPANASKIYAYLAKAGGSVGTFASNPLWKVVDGPFSLKSFSATNSSFALVPNPNYAGSPKSQAGEVDVNTYTTFTSELNAVKSGSLDVMVGLDPTQLGEAPALKQQGIYVFGGPSFGWFGGIINFEDKTDDFNNVIKQLYVRQAIDYLTDQPAIIQNVYKGAAVEAYGPVPSAPTSPYTPSDAQTAPFPFNPTKAVALLKSHGWNVKPGGATTCQKPGTAANECGAGIPAGTPIKFTWANQPEQVSSVGALESQELASEAKSGAGIDIELRTETFNYLTSNYNDQNPPDKKYINDWGVNNYGGLFENYYPTQDGVDNAGGQFNNGGYSDPTASKLITASVFGTDPNAVKAEASYLTENPPVFYLPDQDYLLAVNTKKVGGMPNGWLAMTQQQFFYQFFYNISGAAPASSSATTSTASSTTSTS